MSDRNPAYMMKAHGTKCLVTDYKVADRYLKPLPKPVEK